jgi:hypothetical protein
MKGLDFRIKSRLPVLAKQRFYDDTFLDVESGPVLFVLDAALVETKRGPQVRTKRDILDFPSVKAMLSAVVAGGWKEAPIDRDRKWKPTAGLLLGESDDGRTS